MEKHSPALYFCLLPLPSVQKPAHQGWFLVITSPSPAEAQSCSLQMGGMDPMHLWGHILACEPGGAVGPLLSASVVP